MHTTQLVSKMTCSLFMQKNYRMMILIMMMIVVSATCVEPNTCQLYGVWYMGDTHTLSDLILTAVL